MVEQAAAAVAGGVNRAGVEYGERRGDDPAVTFCR